MGRFTWRGTTQNTFCSSETTCLKARQLATSSNGITPPATSFNGASHYLNANRRFFCCCASRPQMCLTFFIWQKVRAMPDHAELDDGNDASRYERSNAPSPSFGSGETLVDRHIPNEVCTTMQSSGVRDLQICQHSALITQKRRSIDKTQRNVENIGSKVERLD